MKRYFVNLIAVLTGRDPFREELDELHSSYEKAAENVSLLTEKYYKCAELLEAADRKLAEAEADFDKERRSYQKLVENLRERIAENEGDIRQLRGGLLAAMRGEDIVLEEL